MKVNNINIPQSSSLIFNSKNNANKKCNNREKNQNEKVWVGFQKNRLKICFQYICTRSALTIFWWRFCRFLSREKDVNGAVYTEVKIVREKRNRIGGQKAKKKKIKSPAELFASDVISLMSLDDKSIWIE